MKKLIIAAFAVAVATIAQAATVTWGTTKGYLYDGNGDTAVKVTSGTAYLMFVTTTFTQDNLVTAFATFEGDAGKTLEAMSNSGALAAGAGEIGATARVSATSTSDLAGQDASVYFVVFNNDKMYISITGDSIYDAVSGEAAATFNSITASSKLSFDAANGNQGAGWYAVPEPTSALMLLVGLAGLALKRKVA